MNRLYVAYADQDSSVANAVRRGLEAEGYAVWKGPDAASVGLPSYQRAASNVIIGSRAVILIWSGNAASSQWVENSILIAQRLHKPIIAAITDTSPLPANLTDIPSVEINTPGTNPAAQLRPLLPEPEADPELAAVLEKLGHEYIRERKAGITQATGLLEREEYRAELVAILEELAQHDLITDVRNAAQAAVDQATARGLRPANGSEARYIFARRCPNGHVTYFDKRSVCPHSSTFVRKLVRVGEANLDEIYLRCGQCDAEMVVRVDCEGYR
jgi:TIR domain